MTEAIHRCAVPDCDTLTLREHCAKHREPPGEAIPDHPSPARENAASAILARPEPTPSAGILASPHWADLLVAAQTVLMHRVAGRSYRRRAFTGPGSCAGCGTRDGLLHVVGCPAELHPPGGVGSLGSTQLETARFPLLR